MPRPRSVVDADAARAASGPAIAFAAFRLDLRAGTLRRGAAAIPLRPKTWAVLVYLAERPGVLVSKDELFDALWPNVAVTPDTLNKSIGELRAALGDDSQAPRFIETAHRRGFRFIAATRQRAAAAPVRGVAAAEPAARPRPQRSPFVGRARELGALAAACERAAAGERQFVFVSGPAGVGKTALVDAFLDSPAVRKRAAALSIARADCSERHGAQEAYAAIFDALDHLARSQPAQPLAAIMRRCAPLWLAQMPWLLGDAELAALQRSIEGVRPERMPRELAALADALATDRLLVVVLEDLHWSDPATADLLAMLAQRREPARLLVIGTYRRAEVAVAEHPLGGVVALLRGRHRCAELPLDDIDDAAVAAYFAARFPGHDFPPGFAARIHAHTGGHPLFLVATTDHLLARGAILETDPGWRLGLPAERIDFGVPDDVRRTIETQLDGVSPATRAVLQAASVAGATITAAVIAAALRGKASAASRQCAALARAHRFLRTAGTVALPDGRVTRRYAFTHELCRQVVYEETPEEQRALLHRRIGTALERAWGADAVRIAPELVVHFGRGHDPSGAVRALTAAGRRARQRFASGAARGYVERALGLIAQVPDGDAPHRREIEARLVLGRALGDSLGFAAEPVCENYERLAALCSAAGDAAGHFEALYARWYLHALRGDREPSLALATELADLAARLATPAHGQVADSALVRTAFFNGEFAAVPRHMESLRGRQAEPSIEWAPIAYGVDPLVAATVFHAAALWHLGDSPGAHAAVTDSVALARQTGNPFYLAAALAQGALVTLFDRRSSAGGALADEAVALATAEGFALWRALAEALSAVARIQRGNAKPGTRALRTALNRLNAAGTLCISAHLYANLADGYLRAGDPAPALAAVEDGLALATTTLQCGQEPELWRLKREAVLAGAGAGPGPQWAAAEPHLLRALETSRAASARAFELRAATSLARAWSDRDRIDEARALLGPICERFDAALRTPDLDDARALLASMASPHPG